MTNPAHSITYRHVVCALATLVYVLSFPAQEFMLDRWGELWVVVLRCGLGALTLLVLVPMREGWAGFREAPFGLLLRLGAIGVGGCATLLVFAQSLSDPVITTVLICAIPAKAALWDWWADGKRLPLLQWGGVMLALLGGLIASDVMAREWSGFRGGEVLILLSNLLFIWFSRRTQPITQVSSAVSATITMLGATGICLMFLLLGYVLGWQDWTETPANPNRRDLAAAFTMGTLALGFGMALWMHAVQVAGITTAGAHLNGIPFYLMLIMMVLGQPFAAIQAIGGVIVVIGAALVQWPQPRQQTSP